MLIVPLIPAKAGILHRVPAFAGTRKIPWPRLCAAGSPVSRARSAPTASASALRKRATRSPCSHHPLALTARVAETGAARAVLRDPFRLGAVRRNLRCVLARGRHAPTASLSGAPGASRAPARRLAQAHVPQEALGLPDRIERRNDEGAEHTADGRGRREGASRAEVLSVTDLRHIADPDDVAATHALAARLARTMRARLVRREQVRRRGRRLDLRRTIHRNVSHGGTLIDLAWRRRKIKPLRLVVLLDASGSMSLYTAFFVRFLHGVVDASARPKRSSSTPASRMSRRRCATAT